MCPISRVRLVGGHSLIIGHKPDSLKLEQVGTKQGVEKKNLDSFGLFDTAQPNFNTYYENVKPEDLVPKDAEFIYPVFRGLSAGIVRKRYDPIDFSQPGVLKGSMAKLKSQSVYANHEAMIGNELGVVRDVIWQDSYTTENGIVVPAGINTELKIDGKSHPKIARGIMMDPPSIHSASVTVMFAWEKSHSRMSDDEFRASVGKLGPDKQLIRRMCTDIKTYQEISLVSHGADPFAQRIKDGKINDPEYADRINSFSDPKSTPQVYYFDYKTDTGSFSENEPDEPTEELENNNDIPMKETLLLLLAAAGVKTEGLTDEQLNAEAAKLVDPIKVELPKVKDLETKLQTEKGLVTSLTTEKETLTNEKTALQAALDAKLTAKRDNVNRMYKVLNKEPNAAMIATFTAADEKALDAFELEYQRLMDEKYPATCKHCGKHDIVRNSAITEEETGGNKGGKKSHSEMVSSFTHSGAKGSNNLHPVD